MKKSLLNFFPAVVFTIYLCITILLISLYIPFSCAIVDKISIYLYNSNTQENISHIIINIINMILPIISVGLGALYIFITGYIIEKYLINGRKTIHHWTALSKK